LHDSATALVVPLTPIGGDAALRALGASFAAVVAENMNAGELHAALAEDLAAAPPASRRALAARRHAGAVVDGSVMRLGPIVRVTVRLTRAASGAQLATTSVEGPADSILSLADRATVVLLRAWWESQPGDVTRAGLTTSSLAAARAYVVAMQARRQGEGGWRAKMDSVVRYDPELAVAWMWLATPVYERNIQTELLSFGMGLGLRQHSDSALSRLRALPADGGFLLGARSVLEIAAGATPIPSPRFPDPLPGIFMLDGLRLGAEADYIHAMTAAVASLGGLPESVTVRVAREVAAARPSFMPGKRLLFNLLIDAGDTDGARAVLADAFAPGDRAGARSLVSWRTADTLVGIDPTADSTPDPSVLLQWHRFRPLRGLMPTLRHYLAGLGNPEAAAGVAAAHDVPIYVATGRLDSARAAARSWALPGPTRTRATVESVTLPPDTMYVSNAAPLDDADSLIAQVGAVGRRLDSMTRIMPTLAPAMRSMFLGSIGRRAWFVGVLAVQRGVPADAYVAVLDSVARMDSTVFRSLALGLRAEIALRNGDGAAAESLMVRALARAIFACPARYRWLLAQRYAATGHDDLALRMARTITMPSRQHGVDHIYYFADALRLEGELLERLNRPGEAVVRYREYVALREDADAVFQPQVTEVRSRLARLGR